MLLSDDALCIQYNTCEEDPELPIHAFSESVRGMLEEERCSKVILDLRYNTGGNSTVWYPLRDALLAYQQIHGV